jgi:hypothetical protein
VASRAGAGVEMIEIGKKYRDGWGAEHKIGGTTAVNSDWVYSIQGSWFRKDDGRYIGYRLIDPTKPDSTRRHVPSEHKTNWDLVC